MILLRNSLVTQEQHPVLEQMGINLVEQGLVVRGIAQAHVQQLRANVAGQLFDAHAYSLDCECGGLLGL